MHSSRMRTARSLLYRGVSVQVGLCPAGGLSWRSLSRKPSPMDGIGMTDASKNIALPQTSFAGGNKKNLVIWNGYAIIVCVVQVTSSHFSIQKQKTIQIKICKGLLRTCCGMLRDVRHDFQCKLRNHLA